MKTNITKFIAPALLLGAFLIAVPASAHTYSPINGRLDNQNDRINAGFNDHQLTDRQDFRLKADDSRILVVEQIDRSRDDGHLTSAERCRLDGRLNHVSNVIYHDRRAGN